MVWAFLYFHPYLGKIPNLTNIFQVGWNHQLVYFHIEPKIETSTKKRRFEKNPTGNFEDLSLQLRRLGAVEHQFQGVRSRGVVNGEGRAFFWGPHTKKTKKPTLKSLKFTWKFGVGISTRIFFQTFFWWGFHTHTISMGLVYIHLHGNHKIHPFM